MYNKSLKVKVLEEAFNSFLDIINEYASLHDLSDADKEELVKLARDAFLNKNRHKAQRKAKFYINKCRSASCMQSGWKQASA